MFFTTNQMLVDNKATIEFTVESGFIPNVYVSALVIRKPDAALKKLPMSAIGVKNLELEPGGRKMRLAIESLNETRSKRNLNVRVKAAPGSRVALAAVDEGILQITQFRTPNPFNYFYRKRALSTKLFSIFDAILPNIKATKLAIGGDEGSYDMSRRHINPVMARRVKSVSIYSRILKADEYGYVNFSFKIPEFNGELRIIALAANGNRFGSSSKYVTVADSIVISPSYPRFLAPGDNFEIPVYIYNKTGINSNCCISLNTSGPVMLKSNHKRIIFIQNRSERMVYFLCKANSNAGKAVLKITAQIGNEISTSTIELPVRPARAATTIAKNGMIKPDESIKLEIPSGFIKYGQRIQFSVSPYYMTQYLSALDYLVRYPYGCSEQITSTAFPLLYYKKIGQSIDIFMNKAGSIDRYINEAIEKLESIQLGDGRFSVWPGNTQNLNSYISDYVSHFLIKAGSYGYEVNEDVMKRIYRAIGVESSVKKARLDRRENYSWEDSDMYKLYLKSLLGKHDYETMQYFRKKRSDDLDQVKKCWLALCYALKGERSTAREILPSKFKVTYFPRKIGGDFDSVVKRLSIYLIALCEIDPQSLKRYSIAEEIAKLAKDGSFETTHDNLYALMALAKVFKREGDREIRAELHLNGKSVKVFNQDETILVNELSGKELMLTNKGSNNIYYNLMAEGTYLSARAKSINKGIEISRKYYNKDGSELNLTNVVQGQLIVATVTLEPTRKDIDNIVVVDLLPAGFEIDNIRIRSQGKLDFSPVNNWTPAYEDIRDDRLLLFSGAVKDSVSYSYTLRAVSVGKFTVPQIYAEAMYEPSIRSIGKVIGTTQVVRAGM